MFKKLYIDAMRERAFTEFFSMIDPDGLFDKFDIDVIASMFFKKAYISEKS